MTSKWDCPHEWLLEKIETTGEQELLSISRKIGMKLSHDDIQELFQDEMDDDGYFETESDDVQGDGPGVLALYLGDYQEEA